MVHLLDLVPIELCLVRPILIASPFHDVIIWSGYTLPYVGTRELRWSARVPVTNSVERHNGSTLPQESRARHARLAGQARVDLVHLVYLVCLVCLVESD
jgi:hypothetical protein